MGYRLRRCWATNSASTATPSASVPSTTGLRQPLSGTSMMPYTKATRPTVDSAPPARSTRRPAGSRDSGTSSATATRASPAAGTLTRKIEPHQKCVSRYPPTSGPSGIPSPMPTVTRAIALPRSLSANSAGRTATVIGVRIAAPTPIAARTAMS